MLHLCVGFAQVGDPLFEPPLGQLAVGAIEGVLFPLAAYFLDPVLFSARPVTGN